MPKKVSDPEKVAEFASLVGAAHVLAKLPEWKEFRKQWIESKLWKADAALDSAQHMTEAELRDLLGWRRGYKELLKKLDDLSQMET